MMKHICRAAMIVLALCLMMSAATCEELTGMTASEIVAQMGVGWNLGNSFDATGGNRKDVYSQEQSWGNPIIEESLMKRVKDAGFTTIRIPVTWYRHTSKVDGKFTINPAYMARVKEVVDYARAQDLFVIINLHHEEWVNSRTLDKDYEKIGVQLEATWRQIADTFAEYDQHLIFEGMNEPRMAGTASEWNGTTEGREAVNYLNQVFVNTVRRDAKGHNGERCLMIPGYAASSSAINLSNIAIPVVNGEAVSNVIISVHCYSPYDFCLSDNQVDFDQNNKSHTSSIDTVFADVKRTFLDNGIPVVIGETGATNTNNNLEARENWANYMGKKAAEYGVPIIIWDNGNYRQSSGGECHGWIRRKVSGDETPYHIPTVIEALMEGRNSMPWGSGLAGNSLTGGDVIWKSEAGLNVEKPWDNTYLKFSAQSSWFGTGCEMGVVFAGNGTPKLVLESAEKNQWWMEVEPDRIEELGDRQIAWFTARKIMGVAVGGGVMNAKQISGVSVIATNDAMMAYEFAMKSTASQTEKTFLSFKANGRIVAQGSELPADPTFTNMTFAGWYTTRDYRPGTEYTGGPVLGDGTVYAKMILNID